MDIAYSINGLHGALFCVPDARAGSSVRIDAEQLATLLSGVSIDKKLDA
jgi:hypothetical protein